MWNRGYFSDICYVNQYFRDLSPVWLNCVLGVGGFASGRAEFIGLKDNFSYLELGFGRGGSFNAHAASNFGDFFGCDFMSAHASGAKEIWEQIDSISAEYAEPKADSIESCEIESENIKFNVNSMQSPKTSTFKSKQNSKIRAPKIYELNFGELLAHFRSLKNPPSFDFIVLHGVYSWVDKEAREQILEIIYEFLKPGGVVYNSYNALPGFAYKQPVRELLVRFLKNSGKGGLAGIKAAVERLLEFVKLTPKFVEENPSILKVLESLQKAASGENAAYIAHEYLNSAWDCFYFSEVASDFARVKCDFAANAEILENFQNIGVSAEFSGFCESLGDLILSEELRDFRDSRAFRKDIYIKGARKLSPPHHRAKLINTRFVAIAPQEKFAPNVKTSSDMSDFYKKAYKCLAARDFEPKTFSEIMLACGFGFDLLVQGLSVLLNQKLIMPLNYGSARSMERAFNRAKAYNFATFTNQHFTQEPIFAAAPLAGIGIELSDYFALMALSFWRGESKQKALANEVWRIFSASGRRCIDNGKMLENERENLEFLEKCADEFLKNSILYKRLGVL